jgi:hypothetical protein
MEALVKGIYILTLRLVKFLIPRIVAAFKVSQLGDDEDEPIISSADLLSATGLQSLATGMMGDYLYNLMTNDAGRVMMLITLNRNTYVHIVAVGSRSGLQSRLSLGSARQWLEPVSLEGDFPDHFEMYCSKGAQMQTRQVFGPETMAKFVDFCKSYNFELFNESVYISVAENAEDSSDETSMVTDITNFLEHNRRVLDSI